MLLTHPFDQRVALGIRVAHHAELVQRRGDLIDVCLQSAQPCGKPLDAHGARVGIGQEVLHQALALGRRGLFFF